MSLVLNVEILGEFKKLTQATTGSQKALSGLQGSANKISSGINKALGLIGVGFTLNAVISQFKESTKAAIEDEKSKVLLSKALKDNLNITDQQVDSIEQYIGKLQIATGITDDRLRPALSKLSLAAKSSTEGMRLLSIATDVAAGTGRDLDTVSQAMARALAGNTTALGRLVPAVKNAEDPIAELEKMFKGAAEAAANTDPYQRIQIIFGELQEQIGAKLLPYLNKFSAWLATPGGQKALQDIVDTVVVMITEFGKVIDFIMEYKNQIAAVAIAFGGLSAAVKITTGAMALFNLAMANPFFLGAAVLLAGIAAGMATVYGNTKQANTALDEQNRLLSLRNTLMNMPTPEQINADLYRGIIPEPSMGGKSKVTAPRAVPAKPGSAKTTINVNINRAQVNADDVTKAINDKLKNQGSTVRLR